MKRQEAGDWLVREGLAYSAIERVMTDLLQTGLAEVQVPSRAGPRIVRAWFDTVVNPLVQSLESELVLLVRQNQTFTFRLARLDLIRPLRDYLSYDASANLDQLIQACDETLEAHTTRHDSAVACLCEDVVSLHARLAANTAFRTLCGSLLSPERFPELGVNCADEVFGAYPPAERYDLIAQYVVNNTGLHSSHYSTARLWNQNRAVLMGTLQLPEIRQYYPSVVGLAEDVADATRTLLAQFRSLRDHLSMQFDVPLVVGGR